VIQAKSRIESSGPIAIPINVLEFRDDDDDRGDGGRVAVDDDQLRSLDNPPVFCPKSKVLLPIDGRMHEEPQRRRIAYRGVSSTMAKNAFVSQTKFARQSYNLFYSRKYFF